MLCCDWRSFCIWNSFLRDEAQDVVFVKTLIFVPPRDLKFNGGLMRCKVALDVEGGPTWLDWNLEFFRRQYLTVQLEDISAWTVEGSTRYNVFKMSCDFQLMTRMWLPGVIWTTDGMGFRSWNGLWEVAVGGGEPARWRTSRPLRLASYRASAGH